MMTKEQFLTFKQSHPLDSINASKLRDQAYENFVLHGFPTKKDEAWKYTSLSYLKTKDFEFPNDENGLNHEEMKWLSSQLDSSSINIVFTNGVFNRTLSDEVDDFLTTQEISSSDFKINAEVENKIINWSLAFSNQKFKFEITKKNQTKKIVQFTFFQSHGKALFINPWLEINLSEDVSAKIIFKYLSRGNAGSLVNGQTRVWLEKRSNLQFLQIQNESITETHLSRVIFELADEAKLVSLDLTLGARLARHYIQVNFNGEQAYAGVFGVIALNQKQHSDQYTFINHSKGLNQSVQKYKSILADQSNSIFRGRIRIEQDAQKAQSEQLNNSLMLSREANACSIPQLEIYADDVKAGHGSTVGQLNKEEMFYFLSRGIDQIAATQMLAYGFIMEMVAVFEDISMQKNVSATLNQKLNGMFI